MLKQSSLRGGTTKQSSAGKANLQSRSAYRWLPRFARNDMVVKGFLLNKRAAELFPTCRFVYFKAHPFRGGLGGA
jgi:hypothetical protein